MSGVLSENLKRLVAESKQHLAVAGIDGSVPPACAAMVQALPLTHARTSAQFVDIVRDKKGLGPKLFSPAKVEAHFGFPVRAESAEAVLGTERFVFLYCGQFRYPHTQVGFLFSTSLEDEHQAHSEASPFDSGALHKYVRLPDSTESRQAFLRRHSVPVPGYREFLSYRARYLFSSHGHYVSRSTPPVRQDPLGLLPVPPAVVPDPRLWTFEIRVPDEVKISDPHLQAVFYVARLESEPSVVAFLAGLKSEVHVEPIFSDDEDVFNALQSRCLDYLGKRGIVAATDL